MITKKFIAALWYLYGFVYDGLLSFWPYRNLIKKVVSRLELEPGLAVLDLGCGTANVLEEMLSVPNLTLTGVDGSISMLKIARRKLKDAKSLSLVEGDVREFAAQAGDKSFDRIVMVNVLYAIPDRMQFWRDLLRILKPGGKIVITTSDKPGSGAIIREHFQHDHWWRLLSLKLIGVFVLDALINLLGRSRKFPFPDRRQLAEEAKQAGGSFLNPETCYGGSNVIFTVE